MYLLIYLSPNFCNLFTVSKTIPPTILTQRAKNQTSTVTKFHKLSLKSIIRQNVNSDVSKNSPVERKQSPI